jgi:hypothetical protein
VGQGILKNPFAHACLHACLLACLLQLVCFLADTPVQMCDNLAGAKGMLTKARVRAEAKLLASAVDAAPPLADYEDLLEFVASTEVKFAIAGQLTCCTHWCEPF